MTLIYLASFTTLSHWVVAWLLANWVYILLFIAYIVMHIIYGRRSQIDTWCNSQPRIAGVMKLVRSLFPDYWSFLQAFSLIIFGRLPNSYVKIAENVVKVLDDKSASQ